MQDDLHVHRAYNPPVRNRGSWAHDRLADVLSGRDDPGEVDLFPPERVTRMMEPPTEWSLGGEKFQSWWWELKLFVHARTPETTDDFFTPYLKHSSARVRTVARALLARRSPARRGPLLEAQLAEDHFDRYPTLAYWALQELVQDEKDSSRLSEWRSKHWGDVCRFVVDCVRYGKGAEDPAATITRFSASFKRNSEEWKFGYEYQFDYIVDAVCRRKDKSALPLLKTFFDKGWVELAAPVLALHDEGRDFLRTVLDRKDPPNLGGEGGMFAAEAVRAERIAAAWALGQSDRVAEEWKKMSTRIRSCDICMSLKYRVARSTGDETAARDAGVELLDMMDSNSRWPLPRALDLLDDVRGLVQKHGLPTD